MKSGKTLSILVLLLGLARSASAQVPLGWKNCDIGIPPGLPGSASHDEASGTWTITGNGEQIQAEADALHFVYKRLRGGGRITARVRYLDNTHPWARAGVMIRANLDSGSPSAMSAISAGHGAEFQWRSRTGASMSNYVWSGLSAPYWVRIKRSGDTFTSFISRDRAIWIQQGLAQTISMGKNVYIGLAVTSHSNYVLCRAEFDNVTIEGDIAMTEAFTYQGRLVDDNSPADGLYDLQFKLYGDSANENQVGGTVTVEDVDVIDGYFVAELDFGASVLDGRSRWLQIGVRPGDSTGNFTILTPRREVAPSPHAIYAETAGTAWSLDAPDGSPTDAVYVDNNGNVGIGTTSPSHKLHVNGNTYISDYMGIGTTSLSGARLIVNGHIAISYSDPYLRTDSSDKHIVLSGGSGWADTGATMVLRGADASYNPHGIEMYTGGEHRVRIQSNGSVTIGTNCSASASHATVSGGGRNTASGVCATVCGGDTNTASGSCSTVCGGLYNEAGGHASFAAGTQASALHKGTFVWSDTHHAGSALRFASTDQNQFLILATGGVGIGTNNPRGYQLCVDGAAAKSSGGGFWATFSDARLKDIHGEYKPGLSEVCQLAPVRYSYKEGNDQDLPTEGESVGVIAQQVREVLPEAVKENTDGYLMVNNDPIIWAMVSAIKELKTENDALRQRLETLEGRINQSQAVTLKEVQNETR